MKRIAATIGLLLCATSVQADDAKDFDLACAVAVSTKIGAARRAGEDWRDLISLFTFYLGRLTVRDSRTHWRTVITGRVAELGRPVPDELIVPCMKFEDNFIEPLSK